MIIEKDTIGDLCRDLRVKRGMSQELVANDIGMATSTIERIENGKVTPSLDSLNKIMSQYNLDIIARQKS